MKHRYVYSAQKIPHTYVDADFHSLCTSKSGTPQPMKIGVSMGRKEISHCKFNTSALRHGSNKMENKFELDFARIL